MVKIQVNSQGKAYIANGKALEAQSGGSEPVITSLNVTPTTSAQTITAPSGTDGYSPVNVAAVTASIDSDIKASNIKSGVSILGVTGTVTELNGETQTATLTSSVGNTFTPSSGKNAITSITVTPNNQARSVTPTTSSQSLTVNNGYSGNGTITVSAVTSSIDANIQAGNIKKDVQILGVTGTYEGSSGKYKLLDRVKDDSNNEIGTVSGFFTDANDVEYAVVCLDAIYRNSSVNYAANNTTVVSLPYYKNQGVYEEINTATHNTTKILAAVTSTACSHCRSQSFTIDNIVYYGQFPNIIELIDIFKHRTIINSMDTSGGSIIVPNSTVTWSSTSYSVSSAWAINAAGRVLNTNSRASSYLCIPVLEIPNQ
jgi:hypothetical protein